MADSIKYKKGYKYQLYETYSLQTTVMNGEVDNDFLQLKDGLLTVKKGYAWDGASGPTIDTKNSMRGSLVHDAFYQLMRMGVISKDCRHLADQYLHDICNEDGMFEIRSDSWLWAVHTFGSFAIENDYSKEVLIAP